MSDNKNSQNNEEPAKELTPFQKKVKFIWDYYKLHIVISIIVVLIIIYALSSILGRKPYAFYAIMMNTFGADNQLPEKFADYANIDLEVYDVVVNTSVSLAPKLETNADVATSQLLDALTENSTLDVMIMDPQCFYMHSLNSYFYDLREILSSEDIELWQDHFYYVDMAEHDKALENADEFGPDYSWITDLQETSDINAEVDNHRSPEGMEIPIVAGIILDDSGFIEYNNCFKGKRAIVGIIANSERVDTSIEFIHFLWDYQ